MTISFDSPWLHFERPIFPALEDNAECAVAVIGGGISGIVTLYYLLTETDRNILLFEKERVASGATGNNAGLACLHIERPIQDLVKEYGLEKTRQSFMELDQSWDLMLAILDRIGAQNLLLPLPTVSLAMTSVELLLEHIEREKYNREFGRTRWQYYVVDDLKSTFSQSGIDIQFASKDALLKMLNIVDKDYIGAAVPQDEAKLARLNSAKFCYDVINFLSEHYHERFRIYENTSISCLEQHNNAWTLTHSGGHIIAQDVVLCTNGYKNFEIRDQTGTRIETLHNNLTPREGYMSGFNDPVQQPYAQAFFDDRGCYPDSPYFYLTHVQGLTIIGGPEFDQYDAYHATEMIAQRAVSSKKTYQHFLKNTYNLNECHFSYFWYGIMGYTSNGVRWVGEEPQLKHLWYNLGCNGIGITTSIGAGKRLVELMQGQLLPPSIFDPAHRNLVDL